MDNSAAQIHLESLNPKDRSQILGKVYALILSWPDPKEKNEPAGNLGGDAAGSANGTSANADAK